LAESPSSWNANAFLSTDARKPVSIGAGFFYARNRYGGWGDGTNLSLRLRPTGAVNITLGPSYNRTHSIGFYVTQREDPTATATLGGRYLFSELDQKTVDVTLRADVAVTPDLSVQLYAQPFLASGDYIRFKELERPRAYDFIHYGEDGGSTIALDQGSNVYTVDTDGTGPIESISFRNPDFRVRSLRSNLVVRWEYMRGSTLFLVWNHNRSGYSPNPSFDLFDELDALRGDNQQNTFVVKVAYWWSR